MKLSIAQQRAAAKQFVHEWSGERHEKQEAQPFWIALIQNLFGIQDVKYVQFEQPVKLKHVSYIDGYINATNVLIEQKGSDVDLSKAELQSDGQMLTPYEQAKHYGDGLAHYKNPRWIVVCNFKEFQIHDMNRPDDPPQILELANLENECYRLKFLVDPEDEHISKEMEISMQAGELVGALYDALLKQYKNPDSPETLKSLNALCVRLVFCLYAEDAGIFGGKSMFHDYLRDVPANGIRRALEDLFKILDQKPEQRNKYLADDNPALAAFPYVNGGLFSDEDIEIPPFTEDMKAILLSRASEGFDWSAISPTIFGAVFESTLNPETRRSGGMHYTSIENIHKVIDPLFLDDLKAELAQIKSISVVRTKRRRLEEFRSKLASLRFLDPACGSGNFLTETYLSLRRLENSALDAEKDGQVGVADEKVTPIKVSISQFYGIEINDFAVAVAKTALWIAENQMLSETQSIVITNIDPLPLKTNANIIEGNALRLDWEEIVPKYELSYIMGNPPFVGARLMSYEQKRDVFEIFDGWKNVGNLDYVSCWYKKCAELMLGTYIRSALVSTNSVTQGEAVANLWKPLFEMGVHIDFAHRTFRWDSEAKIKAHVHCVIVGFSIAANPASKMIFTDERVQVVDHINGYLVNADDIFVQSRSKPLCNVPEIGIGNKPIDGGFYLFKQEEKEAFVKKEPASEKWFRLWYGSDEFINRRPRWCLWLGDCPPNELRKMPECLKRVQAVREYRLASKSAGTRELANRPTRFHVENMPKGNYILIPEVSSEKRKYVPMGFMTPDTLCSNLVKLVPDAALYHFGVLTSNVHMAWMRAVCGRLEMRYRYSKDIVYNNFPWSNPTPEQKAKIEQTAQAILDARANHPDDSLADLYDELTMPADLRKAHQANDRAVMEAYGFPVSKMDEPACVAALMQMYQKLAEK